MRSIRTMHWNNISPELINMQKRVLTKLGYEIEQHLADRVPHYQWLQAQMESAAPDDVFLFLDIDAFPTTRAIVERAFEAAEAGRIFGVAQTANHVPNKNFIYAAPAFLAVSRRTWDQLGQPSMYASPELDAAMGLSVAAAEKSVPIDILYPSFVCVPRWPLGGKGALGIGSFFEEGQVFHLYESRHELGYREAFMHVAQSVLDDTHVDYLMLFQRLNSPEIAAARKAARRKQLLERFWKKHILRQPVPKARPAGTY